MSFEIPKVPAGSGRHPIAMVVISANHLEASKKFYASLFGWEFQTLGPELQAFGAAAGPGGALRSNIPAGFPGMVPYISVDDVDVALKMVTHAGGSIEKATFNVPGAGRLARFKDSSGTIYGLTGSPVLAMPSMPMPFGSNPKPPAGAICSIEMYAADHDGATRFFGEMFGWGT